MRQRRIHYGIDRDTGLVVSEVIGEGYAIPVLDFEGMKPENKFETKYNLEKFDASRITSWDVAWTRKVPTAAKNSHRKFWNMKELTHA